MKKTLLALAVLAAIAGSAQAQSSVTIYGVADMAVQAESNSGKKTYAIDSGEQNGSRLGFKGTEDLGSGLKAIFDMEMGVYLDNGGSQGNVFGRQAWVGLTSSDFGTVKAGRQYSPQFYAWDALDPFDLGFTSGHAGQSTSTGGVYQFLEGNSAWRVNNSISYQTLDISGFSAMGFYAAGEVAGNSSAGRHIGLGGQYAAGPVYVTAVFYKQNQATLLNGNVSGLKSSVVGGTYDFGILKGAVGFTSEKSDDSTVNNKGYTLGATIPVTPADSILATVARLKDNYANGSSTQLAIGATHALSKRTNLYGSLSRVSNDSGVNGGGLTTLSGAKDYLANFGIDVRF